MVSLAVFTSSNTRIFFFRGPRSGSDRHGSGKLKDFTMTTTKSRRSLLRVRLGTALALFAVLLVCSCDRDSEPVQDFISLHLYSWEPTLGEIEAPIEVAPGRTAYVRKIPLVSSAEITRIDHYDVVGGKGICCHLSAHGQYLWNAARQEHGGSYVIMMIDGDFRSFVRLRKGNDGGAAFCIDGPFSESDARRMAENAQRIYVKKNNLGPDFWKID